MKKVIRKGKVNGLEASDALAMLGTMFAMLCILCTDKGSYINLDLMISGDCVVIMIMIMIMIMMMSIYV